MKTSIYLAAFLSAILLLSACQTPKSNETVDNGPFTDVIHSEWMKNISIYEVNIRQYTPEGTFDAFATHLPRLKELGVDVLWLMPVHPIGVENRKGELGSYYSVKDYKDVNPEFGTMDDFRELLQKTHEMGMSLIIDWVPNHSSWDNPLVYEHPEWYELDSTGQMFSPWDWTDVVKFDYDQEGLREYMINAFKFWLTDIGIDGFRCDVAHEVPVDFWNEVRPALLEVKPDVLMLAEAEKRELHEYAFNMTYAWEFHHIMNEVAKGEKTVAAIDEYMDKAKQDYNTNDMRMYFTSNHDENSWNGTVKERMGNAVEAMAVLSFTLPGVPLIYSGQEAGLDKRLEFFIKDEIPWGPHPLSELYKSLNELKENNPALWNPGFGGDYQRHETTIDESILLFSRTKDKNTVVCLFNLSENHQDVTIDNLSVTGKFADFFTDEKTILEGNAFHLEPWEFHVYIK